MSPQCPRCRSSIVIEGKPPPEVVCPSCGSTVRILNVDASTIIAQPDEAATFIGLPDEATPPSGPSDEPSSLGKFKLLELLGAGSFGTVYKARDTELNRLVALKIPRTGSLYTRADMERFLREAKSAAQLKHPGIVSLYDAGTIDGTWCLVSEFVDGATLAERLSAKRPSFREAAKLIAEVAGALHYAHEHGVVHRDLKPSNIMLDLESRPHVLDFGLARRAADEITVTLEGQIMGTPAYMSPEQARGDTSRVDAQSDIYSLGVVLYELLAGELPFRGLTRMLLVQVIQDEPRPPRRLNDQIPRDLETICLKAMAKEPARRYATAGKLADDLQRFLNGEPVQARPVGRVETTWRWCRRNPAVASLTAAAVFLLIAGTAVSTYLGIVATLASGRADAKASEALINARKEADERRRADREADAAWASQYAAHANRMESDWGNANVGRVLDTLEIYRNRPPRRRDLRGWEWYYQERLCAEALGTLRGHTKWVRSVAFAPDATRLASASIDKTVKLWSTATGEELQTLRGHTGEVLSVVFSPDGKWLASASDDRTVRVWDAATGEEHSLLRGHTGPVWSVGFSPDGTRLASASSDQTARLWDATTGHEVHALQGHTSAVWSVAFSPDGKRLASGGWDKTVKLWDAATGRELRTLQGHTAPVWSVGFSPDGVRLASAGEDQTAKLWDVGTGQELLACKGHQGPVWSVAFSPDGALLASAGEDQTVRLWDVSTGQGLRIFQGHVSSVWGVAFSPDGTRLASASFDQTVKLWDATGRREPSVLQGHRGAVWGVAFNPDGTQLASASEDRTVKLWDATSHQELREFTGHMDPVGSVAFSPDGRLLASGSWDQKVKLWETRSGREIRTFHGHTGPVTSVAFNSDGTLLASTSDDQTVKLWNPLSGQQVHTLKGHSRTVRRGTFSSDGTRLASASEDRTVKLWDIASGNELRTFRGHTGQVVSVAFSPDGTQLVSASEDRTVKLWDVVSGQELRTFKGHTSSVLNVALNAEGTRLASSGRDRLVKLWDVASGQELRSLHHHTDAVFGVAFSPDGSQLASAGDDRTVAVWDARPLTPVVKCQVEAVGLLEWLYRKPLPRSAVRAAIERDPMISEAVREMALELAEHYPEETDPAKYHAAAWPLIRHPHSNVFLCQFGLAQSQEACDRAPDDETYRITLATAQYRLGRFERERSAEALATLTACNENHPLVLALVAMAQQHLGRDAEARAALARLREIMEDVRWTKNPDAQSFLREAAELIEGKAVER